MYDVSFAIGGQLFQVDASRSRGKNRMILAHARARSGTKFGPTLSDNDASGLGHLLVGPHFDPQATSNTVPTIRRTATRLFRRHTTKLLLVLAG